MASFAEILAQQLMAGSWGSELVNDTNWYLPPPGYAIKGIVVQEESVIASAWCWLIEGLTAEEVDMESINHILQLPKNWIGSTLAISNVITAHDKYPISRIRLTSGSVMVYFCKGPVTYELGALNTTTTTEEIPL